MVSTYGHVVLMHTTSFSLDPKPRGIYMDWIFKKMGPAAALSLVAFTSFLNAADDAQVRNLENPCDCS